MRIEKIGDKEQLKALVKLLKRDGDKSGKKILAEVDMLFWRGVPVWVGFNDEDPVTINATYFGKKKANSWEPYANGYTAFTRVDQRRRGYARELNTYIRDLAIGAGCLRLKALAGTKLGYHFHCAFGDQFWGLNDRHMLLVDTPLVDPARFPTGIAPISIRKWAQRTGPLTQEELEVILTEPLHYDKEK